MGRSQKPLRIFVDSSMLDWPEVQQLIIQGHDINHNDMVGAGFDIILGPTCWLMDDAHRKYLPLALAEARKRRYPKESREQSE